MAKIDVKNLENRFQGSLLGAPIGDALGMPTESISPSVFQAFFNGRVESFMKARPHHPCAHLSPGQYTDDAQQLLLLADSLVEKEGFDFSDFANKIGIWGNRCLTEKGFDRFAGSTSLTAAAEIYSGKDPNLTGKLSPSCGSAMRVAPIGLFYFNSPEKLREYARDSSRITHANPVAVESAVFVAETIGNIIRGADYLEAVKSAAKNLSTELSKPIQYVISNRNAPKEVAKIVGSSQNAAETVPMAVSCFLYSPTSFEDTVINAANLVPGDTDSIACIAGAISGAYNGYSGIPSKFRTVEDHSRMLSLGKRLLEKSLNAQGLGRI